MNDTLNFFLGRLIWQELEGKISILFAKQVRIGKKIQTLPYRGINARKNTPAGGVIRFLEWKVV